MRNRNYLVPLIKNYPSIFRELNFNFAKKTKPNIKPVSVRKVANFPIDSSVNIEKLERLIGKKSKSLKT